MRIVQPGSTDVQVRLQAIKPNGTVEPAITYNSSSLQMWYQRDTAAAVLITAVNLAGHTTGHTDGGLLHTRDGVFRFDVPDGAFAPGAETVTIGGSATNIVILPETIQIRAAPIAMRSGIAQAGTANTITLDAGAVNGNDYYTGNVLQIVGGTGAGQARVIIGYVGSTRLATLDRNWASNPASGSVFLIHPTGVRGMTPTEVAEAILDASSAAYNDNGTIGKKINDSGSASVPPTAEEIATEIMATPVATGIPFADAIRGFIATLLGKSARAGNIVTFRNSEDTKDAVTATVDSNGQRTSVSRNLTQ